MQGIIIHLTSVHPPHDIRIFHKELKTLLKHFGPGTVGLIVAYEAPEEIDGIKIISIPSPTSRFKRFALNIWRVYWEALLENAYLYHFHDPELIPVGLLLKLCGKKVIYDVHEDLPRQVMSKYWIPAGLRKIVSFIAEVVEQIAANFLDGIVAATPTIICVRLTNIQTNLMS